MTTGSRPDAGRVLLMLCTAGRGGMRSVVEGYRDDGVFQRWNTEWIVTHVEGSAARRAWQMVRALLRVLALLLRGRVSLAHTHVAMRGSFWRKSVFNTLIRSFGVPVVLHLHGSEFRQFHASCSPWAQRLIAREFERCQRVLVLSESWRSFVCGIAPRAQVQVLPNYVGVPERPPVRAGRGHVGLLFLGVIGERKGVWDLLPAFERALRLVPSMTLTLGGNGEVERARALAAELGIADRVCFAGWVSGAAKVQLLSDADIYVLPSYNEGLPMSVLEAMACGLPVVVSDVGGLPELVVDGEHGRVVKPGDVDGLAEALVALARDAALRARLADAARERLLRRHSKDVVLAQLEAVYAELAGPRLPEPGEARG